MNNSITWKIGGEAGFGIMTTGLMFAKIATRSGYQVFDYVEYPSLIRGGHNVYEVRFGAGEVFSQEKKVDLLVALNRETIDLHKNDLKDGAGVLFDNEKIKVDKSEFGAKNVVLLPIPLGKIVKDAGANLLMQNNAALGASAALLGFSKEILSSVIDDTFGKKSGEVAGINKKSAELGYRYALDNLKSEFEKKPEQVTPQKRLVLTGNDAIALGAIVGGCAFYVAYPMSPSSSVLHLLASYAEKVGMVVKHAEDEISVINMAIGASIAGARAMCGTSGGGFSLMVEGLGFAGITETPLVIFVAQRPGPATGLPTWTQQGDLHFLIHASQDEFPRIILAPGDSEEAFYLTVEAFNLADIYQTPVFVLSDKYLSESHKSTNVFDPQKITIDRGRLILNNASQDLSRYKRYQITPDGISPRIIPGTKGAFFLANSYEHEENGLSTEDSLERTKQVDKRNQKLKTYQSKMASPKIYGEENAEITLIGWGSTKGPVLQALSDLNFTHKGRSLNFLHITHVWPLNTQALANILGKSRKRIMIEGNSYGQMAQILKEQTGVLIDEMLVKYDGRPFYPEEVINKLDLVI